MGDLRYYDTHTICVKSGNATEKTVISHFRASLKYVQQELKIKIPCKFKVNTIINKAGKYIGVSYIYINNSEVYHMLCGRNPDGTERKEYFTYEKGESQSDSWADMAEDEEVVPVYLPSLMMISNYETEPAFVMDVPEIFRANVLCSRDIPDVLSKEDIRLAVIQFTESDKTYPHVEISRNIAFITFDPKTRSAQFALLMIKRLKVVKDNKPYYLGFCHAFNRKKN